MSDKIRARIARCLALAQAASGTWEGLNAQERAENMARKYGIDLATVKVADTASEGAIRVNVDLESGAVWRSLLAAAIGRFAGVSVVRMRSRGRGVPSQLAVIGRRADVETWRTFFVRAEKEIDAEAVRYIADVPQYLSKRSEGDTFRKHAAAGFGERLRTYAAEAAQSTEGRATTAALAQAGRSTSTALVLTSRALAVAAKEAAEFPRLGRATKKVSSGGSSRAAHDGRTFGRSMGVHRGTLS